MIIYTFNLFCSSALTSFVDPGVLGCFESLPNMVLLGKCLFYYTHKLSFLYDIILCFPVFISLESQLLILTNCGHPEFVNMNE